MNDRSDVAEVTREFIAHSVDPAAFHHAEHVRVAFDLLQCHDFIDASATYAKGIRSIAEKAGADRKFNLTITYAFMSLIAERLAEAPEASFDTFAEQNDDLMSKGVLAKWYRTERLNSDRARSIFLLPDAA